MSDSNKHDIANREDVDFLIETFYKKVRKDPLIQHFFNEVVHIDFEKHIPHIADFWAMILLDEIGFKGNPVGKPC